MSRQHDEHAKKVVEKLLEHFAENGRGKWVREARPDDENQHDPTPDYIVRNLETGERAVVEVTRFNWPEKHPGTTTITKSMRRAGEEALASLNGDVTGTYQAVVDLVTVRDAGLFETKNRSRTAAAISSVMKSLAPGDCGTVDDFPGIKLHKVNDSGPPQLIWSTMTQVDTTAQADELQAVIDENTKKFSDFQELRCILVVEFIGSESAVKLAELQVPEPIDELYFRVAGKFTHIRDNQPDEEAASNRNAEATGM